MALLNVNPTRMELKKLKTRLVTARKGHKLLKDKRDEMMKRFLDIVRLNKDLREKVEREMTAVHSGFAVASALSSPQSLEEALMLPKKEGTLTVSYRNIMSVNVPVMNYSISAENIEESINYGFASTSGELDASVLALSGVLSDLIRLAQAEKSAQMLADEIEKTRRRVNALEYFMIPQLQETIRSISMKLEENERGNLTRLMKVKDMMIKQQIEQNGADT